MANNGGLISSEEAVRLLLLEGPRELQSLVQEGWFKRAAPGKWRTTELVHGRIRQLQKAAELGPRMSQSNYARHRNVNPATVTTWKQRGELVMTADGQMIDVLRSDAKLDARPASYRGGHIHGTGELTDTAAAIRMKEGYLAKLRQLEYDKQAELVVDINFAARSIAAKLAIVRNKLLGIGARLAPRITVLKDPAACKAVIDEDVGDALRELSNYDLYRDSAGYDEEENNGDDPADALSSGPPPS